MGVYFEQVDLSLMRGELERLRSIAPDAPNRSPDHECRILRLQAELARVAAVAGGTAGMAAR